MRIVGYLENISSCKVTIFQQGLRYMVKFEDGLYEQSFKFRQSEAINSLKDIEQMIDEEFVTEVKQRFTAMRKSVRDLMDRFIEDDEEFEEEII